MKNWAGAFVLALAAHAVLFGTLWFHGGARPDAAGASGVIEMAVEIAVPPPPRPPAAGVAPRRAPEPHASRVRLPARREETRDDAGAEPQLDKARAPAKAEVAVAPAGSAAPRAPAAEEPARTAPQPAPGSSSLAMRSPATTPDLNLRRDITADLFPSDVTVPAGAAGGSGPVRPGQTVETETLRGRVGRDGSMKIRSKAGVAVGSDLASPGGLLRDWIKDPKKHAADRDGTAQLFRGKFDVTDTIMKMAGQDPYRAERMKMLDATREQRIALATREQADRRRESLAGLPAELRAIWADGGRPARDRRKLIFALWDECEEPTEGDAAGSAAGARARAVILAFVRAEAPVGSPFAYSADELRQLNMGRESRQRFDPYRGAVAD